MYKYYVYASLVSVSFCAPHSSFFEGVCVCVIRINYMYMKSVMGARIIMMSTPNERLLWFYYAIAKSLTLSCGQSISFLPFRFIDRNFPSTSFFVIHRPNDEVICSMHYGIFRARIRLKNAHKNMFWWSKSISLRIIYRMNLKYGNNKIIAYMPLKSIYLICHCSFEMAIIGSWSSIMHYTHVYPPSNSMFLIHYSFILSSWWK